MTLFAIVVVAAAFVASVIGYAVAPVIWMAAAMALEWFLERMGR